MYVTEIFGQNHPARIVSGVLMARSDISGNCGPVTRKIARSTGSPAIAVRVQDAGETDR